MTTTVKPYRDSLTGQIHENDYWKFWDKRARFFKSLANKTKNLAISIVTKYLVFVFVNLKWICSHNVRLFAFDKNAEFSILQSNFHNTWVFAQPSSLGQTLRYSATLFFNTFPLPLNIDKSSMNILDSIGENYYSLRLQIMSSRQHDITTTYNHFHNPQESAQDIAHLRQLHVKMDNAIAAAYGWQDVELSHGFHETKQGIRYTISEVARREVLTRLLKLNHERYAEEVAQGLHDKKKKNTRKTSSRKKKVKKDDKQLSIF